MRIKMQHLTNGSKVSGTRRVLFVRGQMFSITLERDNGEIRAEYLWDGMSNRHGGTRIVDSPAYAIAKDIMGEDAHEENVRDLAYFLTDADDGSRYGLYSQRNAKATGYFVRITEIHHDLGGSLIV